MNTQERINNAIKRYLSNDRSKIFSRAGDANFEMGDGREVAIGVYGKALNDPTLMDLLLKYNGQQNLDEWKAKYEEDGRKGLNI